MPKVEGIIRNIKKVNREEVPENFSKQLEDISHEVSQETKAGIFSLFSSRRLASITGLFCITW